MSAATRGRYWCFTENKHPELIAFAIEAEGLPDGIGYLCGQLEKGEHEHFQGYVELEARQRVSWLKRNLSPTAHFEIRRGTQDEAIHYSCKPHDGCDCKACVDERASPTALVGTFVEFGTPTEDKPGKRNDLLDVKAMIEDGETEEAIADAHFGSWCRYRQAFMAYRLLKAPKRDSSNPVDVIVYYGVTRAGKSRAARERFPVHFDKPVGEKWFDGYSGEPVVLFDEYRGNWMPYGSLLRITDRHSCTVPVKGGHVRLSATTLVFTSNVHPKHWYKDEYWDALAARITEFWIYDGVQDPYQEPHPFVTVLPHDLPRVPGNLQPGYAWN